MTIGIVHSFTTTIPKIPQDFFTDIIQTEAQNVGYFYTKENGDVCCPTALQDQTYECKLETQYMVGEISQQGSKNRTRQSNMVIWFDNVMKQILLKPASSPSSKHKWECDSYCPIGKDATFSSLTSIGKCGPEPTQCKGKNAPANKGSTNVRHARPYNNDTIDCDNIEWTETILGLPASINSMYVTIEDHPIPFLFVSKFLDPVNFIDRFFSKLYFPPKAICSDGLLYLLEV